MIHYKGQSMAQASAVKLKQQSWIWIPIVRMQEKKAEDTL